MKEGLKGLTEQLSGNVSELERNMNELREGEKKLIEGTEKLAKMKFWTGFWAGAGVLSMIASAAIYLYNYAEGKYSQERAVEIKREVEISEDVKMIKRGNEAVINFEGDEYYLKFDRYGSRISFVKSGK